jgi:predicted ABC-type ATPase
LSEPRPTVLILAGPNGAGKSTAAPELLQDALAVNEFVDADVIARGLSAFDPESAAIAAGRPAVATGSRRMRAGQVSIPLRRSSSGSTPSRADDPVMLARIRELAEKRVSFAFETTLASRSLVPWLRDLRASSYAVHLFFLWLSSANLAVQRVAQRVTAGGHSVPEDTVRRRYRAGIRNFFSLYQPLATSWALYDCSGPKAKLVAEGVESRPPKVYDEGVWAIVQHQGTDEG